MHKPRQVQGIAAAEALAALGYTTQQQQTGQTHVGALSMQDDHEDRHTKTLAHHSFTGAEFAALVARDADVRTLDDWAKAPEYRSITYYSWGIGGNPRVVLRDEGAEPQDDHTFRGATPDEARAKAAAWIREQGRVAVRVRNPRVTEYCEACDELRPCRGGHPEPTTKGAGK
jgi:hypothetical protein